MRKVYSALLACLALAGCREAQIKPPLVAQLSGTIEVGGLTAPVRVVRDRWGIPHIYAANQRDLFFAQGFVQAQDRLFQMDLWRRSVQGRLSQVLGANFIERDAMTRRIQYRGVLDAEWASYGQDAQAIAASFVAGINAWVALARDRPPDEFRLAGWKPEFWAAVDLLNRTDAFLSSGDALEEVRRAGLNEIVAETIQRVGAAPFFAGLAADVPSGRGDADKSNGPSNGSSGSDGSGRSRQDSSPASTSRASALRDGIVTQSETPRVFTVPSARYFVHLHAPGWNVIGATSPWLPGVALGHNDRIAWAMAPIDVDTQDVNVESGMGAAGRRVFSDAIPVRGRRAPFVFDTEVSSRGVVIAADREHDRVFTLAWRGGEPGAAAELGALALDRAQSWDDFRAALSRWKMPARRVVFADRDGNAGYQDAAFARTGSADLPHALNPAAPIAASSTRRSDARSTDSAISFAHILGISDAARRFFGVGPVERPKHDDSPIQTRVDARDWDRSTAINAPGQSESPASAHFADLARMWTTGEQFPLAFSDEAVAANAEATLVLAPTSARAPRP